MISTEDPVQVSMGLVPTYFLLSNSNVRNLSPKENFLPSSEFFHIKPIEMINLYSIKYVIIIYIANFNASKISKKKLPLRIEKINCFSL